MNEQEYDVIFTIVDGKMIYQAPGYYFEVSPDGLIVKNAKGVMVFNEGGFKIELEDKSFEVK